MCPDHESKLSKPRHSLVPSSLRFLVCSGRECASLLNQAEPTPAWEAVSTYMALGPHCKGVFTDLQTQDVGRGMLLHANPGQSPGPQGITLITLGGPFTRHFMELAVGEGRNEREAHSFLAWALGGLSRVAALLCFERWAWSPGCVGSRLVAPGSADKW